MNKQIILSTAFALLFIPTLASAATTESGPDFAFRHPVRTEVVYRVERIKWIVDLRQQAGDFTHRQADALKAQADGIHAEEAFFASRHGGRITVAEQKRLNWEVDQLYRQINT
jgi:hypothetical protein